MLPLFSPDVDARPPRAEQSSSALWSFYFWFHSENFFSFIIECSCFCGEFGQNSSPSSPPSCLLLPRGVVGMKTVFSASGEINSHCIAHPTVNRIQTSLPVTVMLRKGRPGSGQQRPLPFSLPCRSTHPSWTLLTGHPAGRPRSSNPVSALLCDGPFLTSSVSSAARARVMPQAAFPRGEAHPTS